ncbi:MAG: hypothetical protein PF549_04015 [Patescibacteria group bacterium]|nr:hypothetical protein [Patescibacteria group bacterium]
MESSKNLSNLLPPQQGEFVKGFREKNDRMDRDLFVKILEMGGISREGENITANDLFSIPKEFTGKEVRGLIATALELKEEELEENIDNISDCFREAKSFLEDYLRQGVPKEIERIEGFKNVNSLLNFLRKTKTLNKGEPMTFSPIACSLTLITLAEWEYKKGNFEGLKMESEYVNNKLFEKDKSGVVHFHETRKKEDEDWSEIGILTNSNEWVNASHTYRGKGKDSTINKILQKPELTAKEVISDGIGLKFEVKTREDAMKLITFLSKNLQENFVMDKLLLSNVGDLLENDESEFLKEYLKDYNIGMLSESNPSSHKNFQTLKLEGEVRVPENGEEGRKIVGRNFEVQVVLASNNNETGLAQHSIYKRAQKLSSYTRLFGSFSEKYFDLICEEASIFSGLGKEKIKDYIKKRFLVKITNSKIKKPKLASKDHIERWEKANFLPKDIEIIKNTK